MNPKAKTREEKEVDKKTLQLAETIRAQRQIEIQNRVYGFRDSEKMKGSFLAYIEMLATQRQDSPGIPDVLGYIQNRTELTRSTIFEILEKSGRVNDILVNPQLFLDLSIKAIKTELYELMINGIRYDKLGDTEYEMRLFEESELEIYLDSIFHEVADSNKTIYDNYIPLDSEVESQFAKDCESSEQVEFYFKLPSWFKIPTPIGNYNPDWALIFKDEKKIYFVAETKSTKDLSKLRNDERLKIKCGEKHFAVIEEVEYRHVTKLGELVE
ncbi:MAG: hypothetical protein WBB45_02880 [Cyclobacteriaceae bacterium]